MDNRYKLLIYKYNILVDGKHVKCNILGWRNALYQARLRKENLFEHPKKIEILNLWTGEIVTIEEAEKLAKNALKTQSLVPPQKAAVRT